MASREGRLLKTLGGDTRAGVVPEVLDPLPGAPDHLLELFEGAHVHDHEVRLRDPLGPAGLFGDPRLGVGAPHLALVHEPLESDVDRGVHDEHSAKAVVINVVSFDEQGDVKYHDVISRRFGVQPGGNLGSHLGMDDRLEGG
jgi:hypothetical protein